MTISIEKNYVLAQEWKGANLLRGETSIYRSVIGHDLSPWNRHAIVK